MDYDPRPGINATLAAMKAEKEQLQQQLSAEIARLQEAKRMAGLIADERSKENVALREENSKLRAALKPFADCTSNQNGEWVVVAGMAKPYDYFCAYLALEQEKS